MQDLPSRLFESDEGSKEKFLELCEKVWDKHQAKPSHSLKRIIDSVFRFL